jgi:hypothetical protein
MNQGESHKSRLISLNYNLLNIRFGLNQEAQFNIEGWNWIKKNINLKKKLVRAILIVWLA